MVIEGESGDYLKVALYFNGKFSAYYLDAANHLYEYHTDDLNNELQMIKALFEESLNLDDFEKHFINIGSKAHFITQAFEYRVSSVTEYLRFGAILIAIIIFFGIGFALLFSTDVPVFFVCFITLFGMLFIIMEVLILKVYFRSKDMMLRISKAADSFEFTDRDGEKTYSKKLITEINMYGPAGGKGKQILTIMEIIFNDGDVIKFPGMLIDPLDFMMKLPAGIKLNRLEQNALFSRTRWSF